MSTVQTVIIYAILTIVVTLVALLVFEMIKPGAFTRRQHRISVWLMRKRISIRRTWISKQMTRFWQDVKNVKTTTGDFTFNPFTWNVVFRPTVSILAGALAATGMKLLFGILFLVGLLPVDPIGYFIFFCVVALVALAIGRPEVDGDGNVTVEKVPETDFVALVTWLGMPTPVLRSTGNYSWLGKRVSLDRSRKPLVGITLKENNDAIAKGFIPTGDVTFQVWNSADAVTKQERSKITLPAKNRAPISGSLTLIFNLVKPRLWLKAVDPALDLGDRARQEYQEMVEQLNDTDIAAIQAEMQDYLLGKPLVTAFVTKDVSFHKAGAMVRDKSGKVMVTVVEDSAGLPAAILTFRNRLFAEADPEMLKAISFETKLPGGTTTIDVAVAIVKVSDPITEVTDARGIRLVRVTFGDVTLSKTVSDAAEQASAEADQRHSQLASARTVKEARKILQPTAAELKNREIFELTTILAAAQDDKFGNIRVVMVPGGNQLAGSIIAAGGQIGGTK